MTVKQMCSLAGVGEGNLNLLGEPPSPKSAGIDVFRMIGGANKKDIVFWLQAADFCQKLLYQLNVVLRQRVTVCWQQPIHFVEKDNCRTVFLGTRENRGNALDGIS